MSRIARLAATNDRLQTADCFHQVLFGIPEFVPGLPKLVSPPLLLSDIDRLLCRKMRPSILEESGQIGTSQTLLRKFIAGFGTRCY